ncbi:MAG: hypothetical protein D6725_11395 [Planctomycetota bacterium]|nr:MAG: hypothetical protein D6725_11395 [Planctomycetota bacterium]
MANLVGYRPQNPPINSVAVPEELEEKPGVGIRVNLDDDDDDGTADAWEPTSQPIVGEDDLIRVDVHTVPFNAAGVQWVLKADTTKLRVYGANDRTNPLLYPGVSEIVLNNAIGQVFVEWAVPPAAGATAELTLEARTATGNPATSGKVALSDTLTFYPFRSIVIVLGGENQTPTDPAPGNHGVFQFAIEQYRNGYDVRMFDEDAVPGLNLEGFGLGPTSGAAYKAVQNAVNRQFQTKVALIGYSHGGGSVYDLAYVMDQQRTAGNLDPHQLVFTAYIDAVQNDAPVTVSNAIAAVLAESRRPPGSQFHTNQYQRNPHPTSPFVGAATVGGDDNVNRSAIAGIYHTTIDDPPVVLSLLKTRFLEHVVR